MKTGHDTYFSTSNALPFSGKKGYFLIPVFFSKLYHTQENETSSTNLQHIEAEFKSVNEIIAIYKSGVSSL